MPIDSVDKPTLTLSLVPPPSPSEGEEKKAPFPMGGNSFPASPGRLQTRCLAGFPEITYHLYVPSTGGAGAPVLVAIHGISRNAEEHALLFAPWAEKYGVVLAVPLFDAEQFPFFQRLGRREKGERADLVLNRLLEEVITLSGAKGECCHLFGFSGGGQFVHRYAIAYPDRVAGIAMGAPGWYTFPDRGLRFPWGIRRSRHLPDLRFRLKGFLRIPALVLVGDQDNRRDEELNRSPRLDRQQGINRLERGSRWVASMNAAARSHGLNTPFVFRVLPASDHSFRTMVLKGGMAKRVFRFFFGRPPSGSKPHPKPSELP